MKKIENKFVMQTPTSRNSPWGDLQLRGLKGEWLSIGLRYTSTNHSSSSWLVMLYKDNILMNQMIMHINPGADKNS
jgi:hypothetical protein